MRGRGARGAQLDGALVGRDALLTDLVAAAHDASRGAGSLVLLSGEAGIGKTSVVRALARAVHGDLAVSWGRCMADGGAPAFWPWRDLVTLDPSMGSGGRELAEGAIGASRFELLNDLRGELLERATEAPLLHVMEDLQWADVASILLLAHVGAAIGVAPVMVVGTLRTGEPLPGQVTDAIAEVRQVAQVHPLPALQAADTAGLVRAHGLPSDDELTSLVHDRAGGNPLFATELLRDLRLGDPAARSAATAAAAVPTRVVELIGQRLARLPALVAESVVIASVVGPEGDAPTVARIQGTTVAAALDLLEQAQAAGLVELHPSGRWQFRHELVRDAVHGSIAGVERARLHGAVLDALALDPGTPAPVLAGHALAALPLLDADRAVALAARAGAEAFDQHAYEEAVVWSERALAAAPAGTAPRWRAELLVRCGEARRHIGEIDQARHAFAAAAELTDDPALLARAALGYADPGADLGIAYRSDEPTTGHLLERAIRAQPEGPSLVSVFLEARLAAELYFSETPERARELASSAMEHARHLDDPRALAAAASVVHDAFVVGQATMEEQLAGSQQLLAWADAAGSPSAQLTAHRASVLDRLAAGDLVGVDADVRAFRRVAEPLQVPGYLWWPALWSAMRALLEGSHERAEERAMAAYGIGAPSFPALALINLSFLLFFLRREQGRLAEMEQPTRDFVASHPDVPSLRVGLALLLAELGRLDEARGLLTAIRTDHLHLPGDRNWPASWFQLARAAELVGDTTLARTLLDDARRPGQACVTISLATVCLGSADLAMGWLLHTVGELDAADEHYVAAAERNSRLGARAWLAQAQADRARLLLDRGRPEDAALVRDLCERAGAAASAIGLEPAARAVEDVRRRLDGTDGAGEGRTSGPRPSTGVFRRAGAVWDLDFAGRLVQIPHARGLVDLAHLLSQPGEAASVLELVDEPGADPGGARGAPALDERARREIRAKLHALDAAEAEAEALGDGERAALAREDRQLLAESVARDLGLGGRSRRLGDPVERARKTVSTRIRRAIAAVGRAHPDLGRHLERSIDTGSWCAYRPAEPVDWIT